MKKMKLNKILLGLGMIGLTTIGNAQWAVTNVDDPLYFGPTGVFTQMMGQMQNSVKSSVDQVATLSEVFRKQQAQLQQDTDARNRLAINQAATAQRIAAMFPTLQACAELSKGQAGAGAMRTSASGGSSGGTSGYRTPAATVLKSESDKLSMMIDAKTKLGTCSTLDNGVGGCSGSPGDYGGSSDGKIPSSDVSPLALKGNTKRGDKLDGNNQEVANYSLDARGIDVANQYISNATLANAPKMIPQDKLQANPGYKSLYDGVMVKLYAAQQAMKDILSNVKAAPLSSGSIAQQYWDANKGKYQTVLGMKAPDAPSLKDIIKFNVANDYFGTPDNTAQSQEDLLKDLSKKVALSNLIAERNLSAQENTNVLLSLMLTQMVTPADINKVNDQYNKIMNTKAN